MEKKNSDTPLIWSYVFLSEPLNKSYTDHKNCEQEQKIFLHIKSTVHEWFKQHLMENKLYQVKMENMPYAISTNPE